MSVRFLNQSMLSVAVVTLVLASGANQAFAWQFKDLDKPASKSLEIADSDVPESLLDLVPTNERFIEPVPVDVQAEEPKVERPKTVKPTPKPEPSAKMTVAKPEPVPMPELHSKRETGKDKTPEKPVATEEKPVAADLEEPKLPRGNPLGSFSRAEQNDETKLETAKFNGIQPGLSSKLDLVTAWGETTRVLHHEDGSTTLVYDLPSFKQIDVSVDENNVVSGIIAHLEEPLVIDDVAKELQIKDIDAVPIPDEFGEILGQAYPERGLLFSFTENIQALRISTIILEPISAEMFRLRAQHDFGHHYHRSLADLDRAIKLNPNDGEAFWMRAQYLDVMGQPREAMKSVQKAIRLKPTNPLYRLTRARLYAKTNRLLTGIQEVKEIIRELDLPAEISGRAHNLLGDMHAMGKRADHQMALKHHLKAIDYSVKAVSDQRFAVRRAAKHVLVNAHVSVARDIALGNFQRQSQVVPKWLLRATEMADEFISDDHGDELLQMQIFRDTLASYAELKAGNFDASVAIDEALRTGRELIEQASDDHYKIQVERMLAESLLHASKIYRTRGQYDSAMKFANNALGLLEGSKTEWEPVAHDRYLEAQLCFLVGSIHAVRDSDHSEAVAWYSKARRRLTSTSSHTSPLYSNRGHGEMFVSMGLSYWEAEDKEEAMRITMQGAEIMKEAVEDGTLSLDAMSIPYGNLATMHGKLGNSSKSQEFAKLVAKIDEVGTKTR